MSELDTLVPAGIELSVAGEQISVKPLKVGQMPAFLRVISPVMKHLSAGEIDWLELFGERGDDLLTAIAIAVGKPRAWIDELAADEAMLLAAKVIEVNADFFTRTVMPRLDGALAAGLKTSAPDQVAAAATAGSMPSST